MVGYDDDNNALTLGDDDSLKVGDYELKYNSTDDEWHAEYGRPIGGELGNHGDIKAGVTYSKDSEIGEHSLDFDGDRGYVKTTFQGVSGQSTRTLSLWVKSSDANGNRFFTYGKFTDGGKWGVRSDENNGNALRVENQGGYASGTTDIIDGNWHHIAVVFPSTSTDVTDHILYVDGSSETISSSSTQSMDTKLGVANIGTDAVDNIDRLMEGNLDDIRFYDRELSASEISDLSNKVNVTNGLIAQWDFEFPETPNRAIDSTGDIYPQNSVPRSTSGSLVPQGLAESVSAGEALADDGNTYSSVQTAVDNASGWVFVGPGTFNETVSVTTAGLTVEGSGYGTLIDATTSTAVTSSGTANVTFRNLSISSANGSGNFARGLDLGNGGTAEGIIVRDSENEAFDPGSDCTIVNCIVENAGTGAIRATGTGNIISNCTVINAGADAIDIKDDDNIIAGNVVDGGGGSGILIDSNADDCVVGGNRIISTAGTGVILRGNDNILYNNRISDSGGISDTGTGNVEDSNLTGPAN